MSLRQKCLHCTGTSLSKLQLRYAGVMAQKCNSKKCRKWNYTALCRGSPGYSSCASRECKQEKHRRDVSWMARCCGGICGGQASQHEFEGEDPENPLQIEADEGAFGLEDRGEKEPGTAVVVNEYVGVMARGQPDSLHLEKRDQGTVKQPGQCLVEHGFLCAQEQGHLATNLWWEKMCCCTPMEAGVTLMLMQMPTRRMTQSSTPTGGMAPNM